MVSPPKNRLIGASVWQQEFYDALVAHENDEKEIIEAYEAFAESAPSEAVRYLINLILDDEKRHHRVFAELANTVRAEATFEDTGDRVPYPDVHRDDPALLEQTRRFLAIERRDRDELKVLARKVHTDPGSDLDAFVVDLLRTDTDRHIRILRFIEQLVRNSPLR